MRKKHGKNSWTAWKKPRNKRTPYARSWWGLVVGDCLGLRTTYRDATGKTAGTATSSGNGTIFRDATGKTVGTKK